MRDKQDAVAVKNQATSGITAPTEGRQKVTGAGNLMIDSSTKLQDITGTVRPHLSKEEFKDLEELLTEYKDIFAVDSEDHGRTNKVYHRIDTGDARPIR
jgi:hypothetical protein